MADRVDLDKLAFLSGYPTVRAMRLELLAYRAAELACREQLAIMRSPGPGQRPAELVAGFEACWKTFADVVEQTLNPLLSAPLPRECGTCDERLIRSDDGHTWIHASTGEPDCEAITDFGTGCRCPKLGEGTPEHAPGFGCQPGYEPGAALVPEVCGTCGEHPCTHHECLIKDGRCLIKGCTAADQHGTPDARPEPGN